MNDYQPICLNNHYAFSVHLIGNLLPVSATTRHQANTYKATLEQRQPSTALVEIVGVSRARTSGSAVTKKGRVAYRGNKIHWYVYFYDDEGKFRKKKISVVEVPYYGSLIRRRKSFRCPSCGKGFRSLKPVCPSCGSKSDRLKRGGRRPAGKSILSSLIDLDSLGA